MSIYYRMDEQSDNMNHGESRKQGMFPRIINTGSREY
jgi:hypothetical protein